MSSHDTWMKRLDPLGELNLNAADDTEKGNWMRRLLLVEKAWRTLDVNGDGSVDMHELVQAYKKHCSDEEWTPTCTDMVSVSCF